MASSWFLHFSSSLIVCVFHHFRENLNAADKPHKYKRPTSSDSQLWFEQQQQHQHQSLSMFERENEKIVELEYDDCDVTVQDKTLTIDEQIRTIGFQV